MIPEYKPFVDELIELCIKEDIGDGDHTSLACIPAGEKNCLKCFSPTKWLPMIPSDAL